MQKIYASQALIPLTTTIAIWVHASLARPG